jgi:hypothetical protein
MSLIRTLVHIFVGLGIALFGVIFVIAGFSDQSIPALSLFLVLGGVSLIIFGLAIMTGR